MFRSSQIKTISTFCLACLLILFTQSSLACSKIMRWGDDPPFTFVDKQSPELVKGISIDIAQNIFSALGCELKFEKMPWARALESVKSGHIDLISGAFSTSERQEFVYFSSIPLQSPNVLFLRRGEEPKWKLSSLADITNTSFKLGIQIDVSYSREFDLLIEKAEFMTHLHANSSRASLWQMLSLKRVDGVIADRMTGLIELKNLGMKDEIVPSSLIVSNEPSFFAFSKKTTTKEFVGQFDTIFLNLRNDGTIDKIEDFYLDQ